jgi:hypothetical protein
MTERKIVDIEPRLPIRRPIIDPLLPLGEVVPMQVRLPIAHVDKLALPGEQRAQWCCVTHDETGRSYHWTRSKTEAEKMVAAARERYADRRDPKRVLVPALLAIARTMDPDVQRDFAMQVLEGLSPRQPSA